MQIDPGTSPDQVFQGGKWILSRNGTLKENNSVLQPACFPLINPVQKSLLKNSDREEEETGTNKEHLECLVASVHRVALRKRGLASEVV